jgi:hypothetical protein
LRLLLEHALKDFRHVVDGIEDLARDQDRALALQGEDDGVAWTGV